MKIVRILNDEGISSPRGKLWNKPTVHNILRNEAYLGTLVWGNNAKDGAEPVRVDKAFPATVARDQFDRVNRILRSRAPKVSHPRRVGSTFLLSGLVKCYRCKRALSGRYSSRGTFPYYVCHSFVKRAPGSCDSPRVDARQFEELVVGLIRSNILTEGNIRSLVNVVDEQMDDVAGDERKRLETIEKELADVRGRLDRLYDLVETTTEFNMADFAHRIRDHKERQERLESAAEGARAILAQRRAGPRRRQDHHRLRQGHEQVLAKERADRAQGLHRDLRQRDRAPARQRRRPLLRPHARRQLDSRKKSPGDTAERLGGIFRKR